MALIPLLMRAAQPLKLVDSPDERKVHVGSIPRVGGIAIVAGAIIPILMWVPLRQDIAAFLVGSTVLLIFGIWDDRAGLDYRLKLLGQFLAALIVIFFGGVLVERVSFGEDARLAGYAAVPLTVIGLIGITNAINLSDGLDGLAGGTSLLTIGCIGLLAYLVNDTEIALVAVALVGAILGFLRFNSYPARIFMGDTGSQFVGFSAGVLAIIVTQKSTSVLSPALPILLLGLPILDTLYVMAKRLYERRSPFKPDRSHIHHRLLALGFNHYEAVLSIYLVQAMLATTAYFFRYEWDHLIIGLYLLFCLITVGLLRMASVTGWQLHREEAGEAALARIVRSFHRRQWLIRGPTYIASTVTPFFLVLGAVAPNDVSMDFGIIAVGLFGIILLALLWQPFPFDLLERLGTYVTVAFVVYLYETSHGWLEGCRLCIDGCFVALAMAVAVGVRFSGPGRFQVSPLDFLVIFIALLVPNLSVFEFLNPVVGGMVIKMVILFYAAELLLTRKIRHWDILRFSTLGTLLILGVRGLV